MPTPVIAHRGNSSEYPENTLAAFESALALGVPAIELDVRLTRDGEAVVIHDETIERTTDSSGRVADLTLAELRGVSAGCPALFGGRFSGERVPTLAEAADLVRGRAHLLVEFKGREDSDGETERVTVKTLRGAGMLDALLVAFEPRALALCRDLAPDLRRGLLAYRAPVGQLIEAARALGCRYVLPEKGMLSTELVETARRADVAVATWLVDDPSELDGLEGLGLAGVGSNRPRQLLAHQATRGNRP